MTSRPIIGPGQLLKVAIAGPRDLHQMGEPKMAMANATKTSVLHCNVQYALLNDNWRTCNDSWLVFGVRASGLLLWGGECPMEAMAS